MASGAGAAALACLELLVGAGPAARERLGRATSRAWSTRGRTEPDGRLTRRVRPGHRRAHPGRGDRRRRRLPRPVGRRRAEAGDGGGDGRTTPLDLRAGQPDARDPARGGRARCAPTRSIATGRSDYPNQVNNVLVLPLHLPRRARRRRHRDQRGDEAGRAPRPWPAWPMPRPTSGCAPPMARQPLSFGPEYLIPKPFDPRLILEIAPAVARAAMESRRGAAADRRFRRLPRSGWSSSSSAPAW